MHSLLNIVLAWGDLLPHGSSLTIFLPPVLRTVSFPFAPSPSTGLLCWDSISTRCFFLCGWPFWFFANWCVYHDFSFLVSFYSSFFPKVNIFLSFMGMFLFFFLNVRNLGIVQIHLPMANTVEKLHFLFSKMTDQFESSETTQRCLNSWLPLNHATLHASKCCWICSPPERKKQHSIQEHSSF